MDEKFNLEDMPFLFNMPNNPVSNSDTTLLLLAMISMIGGVSSKDIAELKGRLDVLEKIVLKGEK